MWNNLAILLIGGAKVVLSYQYGCSSLADGLGCLNGNNIIFLTFFKWSGFDFFGIHFRLLVQFDNWVCMRSWTNIGFSGNLLLFSKWLLPRRVSLQYYHRILLLRWNKHSWKWARMFSVWWDLRRVKSRVLHVHCTNFVAVVICVYVCWDIAKHQNWKHKWNHCIFVNANTDRLQFDWTV